MGRSVSVIVPTYNGANYIREAIDSALAQTLPPAEIIVVDDGSTDGTADVVKGFGDRVTYIYQDNKGTAGAYNTGIRVASGEYLAFLEQDDIWAAEKNATQAMYFERNEKLGMVFCPVHLRQDGAASKYNDLDKQCEDGEYSFAEFFSANRVLNCSTVMIRRAVLDKVGQFREDLRLAFDYDLWLRVAAEYAVECWSPPLVTYRIHSQNLSRDDHELMAAEGTLKALVVWRVSSLARSRVGSRNVKSRIVGAYARMAWDYAELGDRRNELEMLWEAVKVQPLEWTNWREYLWRRIDPSRRSRLAWYIQKVRRMFGTQ